MRNSIRKVTTPLPFPVPSILLESLFSSFCPSVFRYTRRVRAASTYLPSFHVSLPAEASADCPSCLFGDKTEDTRPPFCFVDVSSHDLNFLIINCCLYRIWIFRDVSANITDTRLLIHVNHCNKLFFHALIYQQTREFCLYFLAR